ncbi:lysozyme [Clostridium acidisoli DSM 12555]|uniref:Lysozyme n=1 Tax=Clostridium acidisoli DSM 12555 TaxID=1121291 RepID=A0A1W1XTG1_9CLOT|nr:GH25 family lysozyme [Clostridium acidisoli]SMC26831.1 lysozyme [Clostridium acidisoli DSM 12555]
MKGIDIYSETIITDWSKIKNDGVEIVYIKATEGKTYVNPRIDNQYNEAKNLGMKIGFYHFAGKNNVMEEYSHFISTISRYVQDLKPVLDYEVGIPDMNFVAQFMKQDLSLLLYTSHNVADICGLPKSKIWIAEPSSSPTSTGEYAGIQYAWTGRINGIEGNADLDLFSDLVLATNTSTAVKSECTESVQRGDPNVRIIQLQLNTLLEKGLAVDSINGPETIAAIKEFQGIMGLIQDGIWGPNTAGAVGEIYSRPVDSVLAKHYEYATRYIQYRVGAMVDGIFGNGTKIKVQNWQASRGLNSDGIVGNETWAKLFETKS